MEAPTLVPPTSSSAKVTFFGSNTIANLRLLESLENGPLHTTAFMAAPGTGFAAATGCEAGFADCAAGLPAALAGLAARPGIGCVICDGASWSSGLRFGSC